MDVGSMRQRCPGATLLRAERLAGYRFVIARAGFAGLVPDPAARVHGVLWDLTPADEAALDEFEGVAEGLYRRVTLSIGGGPALVYVPVDHDRGEPQPGYLRDVLAAARSQGLPRDYIAELEGWLPPHPPR
jgi:gamma-glutamylcyclotransferase (GGCT)/AIG2-like uncharacterized protein YtfP